MASLGEIQRLLRQQRAVGKPSSTVNSRALYEAYFDAQAAKNLQRGALNLEREKVETQGEQFERSLAQRESEFSQNLALSREQMEAQEEAAKVQGITQLGTLAFMGSQTDLGKGAITGAKKLGGKAISSVANLFGGPSVAGEIEAGTGLVSKPALSVVPTTAEALTSTGGIEAGTGLVETASTAAPSGGLGAIGTGAGIVAAAAIDDILSRKVAGTEADPREAAIQKTRGITRYGGSSPLTTSLIEKGLGEKGRKVWNVVTDPTELLFGEGKGVLSQVEKATGGIISASIPKFLGGGGSTGSKTVDRILNPLGTWICTKTKETVGMTEKEWYAITKLKRYSLINNNDWMEAYMKIGPELIESINGDDAFYENLKETFIIPVVGLVDGGYMEAAYLSYKSVCLQLIDKYNPGLMEAAPGGENG